MAKKVRVVGTEERRGNAEMEKKTSEQFRDEKGTTDSKITIFENRFKRTMSKTLFGYMWTYMWTETCTQH